jgi:hypothetical protein
LTVLPAPPPFAVIDNAGIDEFSPVVPFVPEDKPPAPPAPTVTVYAVPELKEDVPVKNPPPPPPPPP